MVAISAFRVTVNVFIVIQVYVAPRGTQERKVRKLHSPVDYLARVLLVKIGTCPAFVSSAWEVDLV